MGEPLGEDVVVDVITETLKCQRVYVFWLFSAANDIGCHLHEYLSNSLLWWLSNVPRRLLVLMVPLIGEIARLLHKFVPEPHKGDLVDVHILILLAVALAQFDPVEWRHVGFKDRLQLPHLEDSPHVADIGLEEVIGHGSAPFY